MTPRARRRLTAAYLVGFLTLASFAAAQSAPPELTEPVNDFAGVIDSASAAALDTLIRRLQAASGDVIAVATIKTFQPSPDIRSYAAEMFENGGRGIGQKGRDNGLLVLLAQDDRAVWIEVGYDLESFITDGFAGETSRQVMTPHFRQGEYGAGLLAGVTRIAQRIAQGRNVTLEGVPVPAARPVQPEGIPIGAWILLGFVGLNLLRATLGGGRRRRQRWYSHVGPFGGGFGGWSSGGSGWSGGGGFGGGFGGFGGGRSGGGGGGGGW